MIDNLFGRVCQEVDEIFTKDLSKVYEEQPKEGADQQDDVVKECQEKAIEMQVVSEEIIQ